MASKATSRPPLDPLTGKSPVVKKRLALPWNAVNQSPRQRVAPLVQPNTPMRVGNVYHVDIPKKVARTLPTISKAFGIQQVDVEISPKKRPEEELVSSPEQVVAAFFEYAPLLFVDSPSLLL